MAKDRRKNSQTYLEERRREQAERRRRLDQAVRQKEKKREELQKERQARHRAELEQYAEKKRAPIKRKNKIVASRKSSRLRPELKNNKKKPNKIKVKQTEPKTQFKAKRVKQKSNANTSHAKGLSTLGWIICGVLAGCLLGGFSYLYFLKPTTSDSRLAVSKIQPAAVGDSQKVSVNLHQTSRTGIVDNKVSKQGQSATSLDSSEKDKLNQDSNSNNHAKAATAKSAAPRFEFYTILPKQEVWSPPKQDVAKASENSQKNQYVLQIASFRNSKDATQLLQRLEKLKLHPYLSTVKLQSGQQWNRVMLGPFASKRDAEKIRRVLQDASIQPGLLKLKKNS